MLPGLSRARKITPEEPISKLSGGSTPLNIAQKFAKRLQSGFRFAPSRQRAKRPLSRPLPEALTALTQKTESIGREVHAMREYLPNLRSHTDLTAVQNSMTEMQKSLTEMTALLEQAGKGNEQRTCIWLDWLPDFDLIVVTKWIVLVLLIVAALLGMGYGTATVVSNIRNLFL